jgi:hypothetical protein
MGAGYDVLEKPARIRSRTSKFDGINPRRGGKKIP